MRLYIESRGQYLRSRAIRVITWPAIALICGIATSPISSRAAAQAPPFGYVKAFGSYGEGDQAHGVAMDACGNVYVTGYFSGTVDLDPGPGTYFLSSNGSSDIFIAKWSRQGSLLWAASVGGSSGDQAHDIVLDSKSEVVYVTGSFSDTVDFDPGPGTFNLTSVGAQNDAFVWKLDSDGNFLWVGAMGGSYTVGNAVALDHAGDVYVTGIFHTSGDFDPGPGVFTLTVYESPDVFVCKLGADGSFRWASAFRGPQTDTSTDLTTDSAGNTYVTGYYLGTVDVDPGPDTYTLSNTGFWDAFVVKLGPTGALDWAGSLGGSDVQWGLGIALDEGGSIYVSGLFNGLSDFDPGVGTFQIRSATSQWDGFVCKLDRSGSFQWVQPIGGPQVESASSVVLDGAGNLYLTGSFQDTVDFDTGPGTFELRAGRDSAMYILKLDSAGAFSWAAAIGGNGDVDGYGIALAAEDVLYAVGSFDHTIDFDPGVGTANISSAGSSDDVFVLKLEVQTPPIARDDHGETDAETILTTLSVEASDTLLANDCEVNTFDELSVTGFDATSALGAAVTVNPDGTFVYNPTNAAFLRSLLIGESVDDTFSYRITDGTDTASGNVTIAVEGKGVGVATPWGLSTLVLSIGLMAAWRYNTNKASD